MSNAETLSRKPIHISPSEDVVAQYVKFADHVMDSDEDLQRMWEAVCEVSDKYFEYDLTSPGSG